MTVYGEETFAVAINKGLWTSDSPDMIPDGFCAEFKNLEVSYDGSVVPRGELYSMGTATSLSQDPTTDYSQFFNSIGRTFTAYTSSYGNMFMVSRYGKIVGTPSFRLSFVGDAASGVVNKSVNSFTYGVAQYSDRVYLLWDTGVNLVTNWVTSATLITTSVVNALSTSFGSAICLLTYKDRLFSFFERRIYYTDVAAVGGYPETWNTSTNFVILPSGDIGNITAAKVFRDRLFVFTTKGVYILNAPGSPTTWTFEKATGEVIVLNQLQLDIVKDVIVYTDGTSVYMWTGTGAPVDIGDAIKYQIRLYDTVSLTAYRKGFILNLTLWNKSTGAFTEAKTYYFNGEAWAEFTLTGAYPIVGAVSQQTNYSSRTAAVPEGRDIMVNYNGEFFSYSELQTGGMTCSLITKDITPPEYKIMKRYKYAYLFLRLITAGITSMAYSTRIEGAGSEVSQGTITLPTSATDLNHVIKIKGPQFATRISYSFTIVTTAIARASASRVPLFKLKDFRLIGNSDNRNIPDADSP